MRLSYGSLVVPATWSVPSWDDVAAPLSRARKGTVALVTAGVPISSVGCWTTPSTPTSAVVATRGELLVVVWCRGPAALHECLPGTLDCGGGKGKQRRCEMTACCAVDVPDELATRAFGKKRYYQTSPVCCSAYVTCAVLHGHGTHNVPGCMCALNNAAGAYASHHALGRHALAASREQQKLAEEACEARLASSDVNGGVAALHCIGGSQQMPECGVRVAGRVRKNLRHAFIPGVPAVARAACVCPVGSRCGEKRHQ